MMGYLDLSWFGRGKGLYVKSAPEIYADARRKRSVLTIISALIGAAVAWWAALKAVKG